MKIGIITCFDFNNVNFGNRLQTFALNYYINNDLHLPASTLYFDDFKDFKRTKKQPFFERLVKKIERLVKKKKNFSPIFSERLERFNDFSKKNTVLSNHAIKREELENLPYDTYIVGSDVVWYQWRNGIRPVKLLDFKTKSKVKKISYAASFGNDYIPNENIDELKRCFSDYSAISVRENSSVSVMATLGRNDAVSTIDPTLLLSRNDWENIESPVNSLIDEKYIFTYLLSSSKADRENIKRIAREMNLKVVNIPFASGKINSVDDDFADIKLMNCSPEEWVWLVHHASYVITDSFHGTAFSVKFNVPFVVTKRKESFEMNNRMIDFLSLIDELDKFVDLHDVNNLNDLSWNFDKINSVVEDRIDFSKNFLNNALKID
ncbi:MAG: polysaccharide pyruvyl transferase family protein [Clostridia bacterium]|nr:polysaccharide pyruvyl transferase family protein [Clostridia bacterium]